MLTQALCRFRVMRFVREGVMGRILEVGNALLTVCVWWCSGSQHQGDGGADR